jgi:hypothetical protein
MELNGERERELLRRVLQYDIQDAVSRFEAEAGLAVSQVKLTIAETGECSLELETRPGRPHQTPPLPAARMLILNLSR